MSFRLGDLQKNAKLNAWYETLQERKASGQSVDVWCQERDRRALQSGAGALRERAKNP